MNCYFYAQLDENNICIAVSQLSGEINQVNMIRLDNYDDSVLCKKYNNGVWEEVPQVPVEPQPTEQEIIQAELMLNQAQILANQQSQDEVLATILLEQARGQTNV